ncbi:MAG: M12 family metallo-peptidase, partial [Verrucomicrobiota bacterium]
MLKKLGDQRIPAIELRSLQIDPDGMLYYACSALSVDGEEVPQAAFAPSEAPVPVSSPPARSSRPGSANVIYLDFNGHAVTGTAWNTNRPATLQCVAYDLDADPTTFSDYEQSQIIEIWERVAEDYRPFDVNVTTVEPLSFGPTVARALITRNTTSSGQQNPSPTAGGVAYLGVFGQSNYHTLYSPAFAYHNRVGNTAANIAEVISHEVGHNFGLNHDGGSGGEYYTGHGTGESSWAPIMGAGYGRNFTQWSKGDYAGAT